MTTSAYWTLFIIFLTLSAGHLVFFFVRKFQEDKDFSRVSLRIKTWWGMFIVFAVATLFNPLVSMLSLMILCFFSLKEYFSMMKTRKADRRIFLWAYLSIPLQFYWIYLGWYGMFIVFIPVYVFLLLPLPRIIGKGTVGFLRSVSSTQWGLMLMVFGLSHLAYFQVASPQYGANLVLYLVILTQVSDIVQHVVSIYAGRLRVVPTANPAITWEGYIVCLLVTMGLSYSLYPYLTPLDATFGLLSGVIIATGAFIGSLTVSVLKRDLLIGDRPKFTSLQESYLNRVDSLAYTAPIFFHIIRYYFDFM